MLGFLGSKDRRLGVAEKKRQYDLPLNQDEGTVFLKILIGLMSFLAIMALAFSFSLGNLADQWSSGLENKLTIEIPAQDPSGKIRTTQIIENIEQKIENVLQEIPDIKSYEILKNDDIQDLISPWLGEDLVLRDIPLPGLISVEFHKSDEITLAKLKGEMTAISKDIHVDAHEDWLSNILRLTGSLQFAGLVITFVIGMTTVAAVAGAVRSRIAIHRADVELLHLMGASDIYITRQFQRHALIMALHGSMLGTLFSLITLTGIYAFSSQSSDTLLPSFSLNAVHMIGIALLPMLACLISATVARFTVLRTLSAMP